MSVNRTLFSFGGIVFDHCITLDPPYKVNNLPDYEEWEDADKHTHRYITRFRISGEFTMKFFNESDFYTFLTAYQTASSANANGSVSNVTLTLNNETEAVTDPETGISETVLKVVTGKNLYIDFEVPDEVPIIGRDEMDGISVKIEEV